MENYHLQRLISKLLEVKQSFALHMDTYYSLPENNVFSTDLGNYAPLKEFWQEVEDNLHRLQQLSATNVQGVNFLAEKILQQYSILQDTLNKHMDYGKGTWNLSSNSPSSANINEMRQRRNQRWQELQNMPARERLSAYYEALNQLNMRIEQLRAEVSQNPELATKLAQTINRRNNAIEHIETLESYLCKLTKD